jgi:hypothetical protein
LNPRTEKGGHIRKKHILNRPQVQHFYNPEDGDNEEREKNRQIGGVRVLIASNSPYEDSHLNPI